MSDNGLVLVSEMLQSERLLVINKGCHEQVIHVYTIVFYITKPVDKTVEMVIFTKLTPTPN